MTIDDHGENHGNGSASGGGEGERLALVEQLAQCLRRLDQLGATLAAAHVDAAIHELLAGLGPRPRPAETE